MTIVAAREIEVWQTRLGILGFIALIALFVGGWFQSRHFFASYLYAYFFWLGLAIGCAIITMIHHLTGGKWGHPIRRFLEAGVATLPLMALLFVPILFGLRDLYPWARPEIPAELIKKGAYLNRAFFIARAVFYFVLWSLLAWKVRALSLAQDDTVDTTPTRRLLTISGPGLTLAPITATFAYIDWIMSLEPRWHSTVFALIILASQILTSYCFAIVLLNTFSDEPSLFAMLTKGHYHQLGNLLLTFVLFWAYLAFSQLLIIYSANKPGEIDWYLHRITPGWKSVISLVALFQFLLPFLILLFRGAKQSGMMMGIVSGVLICINLVYTYWLVLPSFRDLRLSWLDFAAPIGIGGIWLAVFLSLLKRAPLVPLNDPRMREELAHARS
jgi:hypothetical protein